MDDALGRLAQLLEEAEIEYALIGGHAVNAWVEPRFTADIDITIEAGAIQIERLTAVLAAAGFAMQFAEGADEPSGPDFVRFASADDRLVLEFQAAKTELQRTIIRRARSEDRGLRVATPEDLIVLKLIANRTKDQIDLIGLCGLSGIDWDYVEGWAEQWEISELLQRFKPDAER